MFEINGKSFRRKDTHYITLKIKNVSNRAIVSARDHKVFVRPVVVVGPQDYEQRDPVFGRSTSIERIDPGQEIQVKVRIKESDLPSVGGTYELIYGVVQEFVRWHEGKKSVFLTTSYDAEESE
tara:strand:+ start:170 stop:538 length:369 start_codon:yes stop_codon:yes gene_type:complete